MNKQTKSLLIPLAISATLVMTFSTASAQEMPQRGLISFATYDANEDGSISETEFNEARAKRLQQRASEGRPMRGLTNAPAFTDIDQNSDGKITTNELTVHQQARASQQDRQGKNRTGKRKPDFASVDLNADGCIDANEFSKMRDRQGKGMRRNSNIPAFEVFDTNNDTYISAEELAEGRAKRIAERAKQGYQMKNLANAPTFSEIDANSDGKVDQNEFATHQAQHRRQGAGS